MTISNKYDLKSLWQRLRFFLT